MTLVLKEALHLENSNLVGPSTFLKEPVIENSGRREWNPQNADVDLKAFKKSLPRQNAGFSELSW